MEEKAKMTSQQELCPRNTKGRFAVVGTLKMFIAALAFVNFSKALLGAYIKSSITQIERRFDLSSTHVGLIDGSFEIGNLFFLALVSHFGAKMHRPRLIAIGCIIMSVGAFLTGLIHFFMGRYKYDSFIHGFRNSTENYAACARQTLSEDVLSNQTDPSTELNKDCVSQSSSSNMWIYVFLGNALRGIGETPCTPLGISYIDDFAKAENSPFYIACLQTITLLGPFFGFLLGSYCANLYVDFGFVDMESITITPKDARWVGAWWVGFLVGAVLLLMSSVPFWFLPRSLPKQEGKGGEVNEIKDRTEEIEDTLNGKQMSLKDIARGFLPSLKRLLATPAYILCLCDFILRFSAIVGLITFKGKYLEQQFGQSASRANFLIGVLNLPAVAVGIFLGGLIMRRYKLDVLSSAKFVFGTSFTAFLLSLLQFHAKCDNIPIAGVTVSYSGGLNMTSSGHMLLSECNRDCACLADEWDPVCSDNKITYISPCLAGCYNSTGFGKNTVFNNCQCVSSFFPDLNSSSVKLGPCPQLAGCSSSFTSYMFVSVLSTFISALGTTPGYMIIIRCISADLKSLAIGILMLLTRTLGGIPAPIYFGSLIDSTCLKWSVKDCGGRGACRVYDNDMYRLTFLGLITGLTGTSYFFFIGLIVVLVKEFGKTDKATEAVNEGMELERPPDKKGSQTGWEDGKKLPQESQLTSPCKSQDTANLISPRTKEDLKKERLMAEQYVNEIELEEHEGTLKDK
ncbi:solute carrier organic anion transporter family member 1C1-like isoform X1 [Synchiropus splendidus]|uniref:solute carrier organic anion transporter family member 1C1-like isoform X1 n=2 Tax=Synchiropus splendidus TaxID=270530 RepID=UPI00237D611B|nr:solute carrier organic anion transporter family member 1C1-like isoform X1 [Synchiropus splendidus]